MIKFSAMHEWMLITSFLDAARHERYEECAQIKAEIKQRITSRTINVAMALDGFRRIDTGAVDFGEHESLFQGIREAYPDEFTRQREADYLLSLPVNQAAIQQLIHKPI